MIPSCVSSLMCHRVKASVTGLGKDIDRRAAGGTRRAQVSFPVQSIEGCASGKGTGSGIGAPFPQCVDQGSKNALSQVLDRKEVVESHQG